VVEPAAAALARACVYLGDHADDATAWGRAGKEIAERVTWDACVDALLS
jgi:glycosyltransferase involved in cell wall biosynthesis